MVRIGLESVEGSGEFVVRWRMQCIEHLGPVYRDQREPIFLRDGDELVEAPFQRLIEANQLMAFRHEGFWRPMDTLKDKQILEDLVEKGTMPWLLNLESGAGSVQAERKIG